MMPVGLVFRMADMRVGHYGPKFAGLYLSNPGPGALFVQHLVLGWISALPLALLPLHRTSTVQALGIGALYGSIYYALVNALALPLYFGNTLPMSLGAAVVAPSLIVHIVYGVAASYAARLWRRRQGFV